MNLERAYLTFSRQNLRFSSAKISDDFFSFSHRPQILNFPPYFASFSTFPPRLAKILIPPLFSENSTAFYILSVYFPPTLAMMHLCITQCTYWTPLLSATW